MVANVRHLTTGYISPQFHVVFDDLFETVNRTGVDDQVVESICNGLFQRNRELYAEDELDEVGNLIYRPPPLHEVWLDEAGRRQGNKDCIRQHRRNEDLMRDRNRAVKKSIPPPVVMDVDDAGEVPGVAPISDDGSVDSLLFSRASESEGDIWGNIFWATTTMMMPLMLMREQIWSHPISMEMREYSRLPTLLKLLRELIEGLVGKQKSIHQPCGAVVLMAKWSAYY